MNVSAAPVQRLLAVAVIVTDGVTVGLTVTGMEFEVAAAGDGHVAVEVMTQDTDCPLVSELVMN